MTNERCYQLSTKDSQFKGRAYLPFYQTQYGAWGSNHDVGSHGRGFSGYNFCHVEGVFRSDLREFSHWSYYRPNVVSWFPGWGHAKGLRWAFRYVFVEIHDKSRAWTLFNEKSTRQSIVRTRAVVFPVPCCHWRIIFWGLYWKVTHELVRCLCDMAYRVEDSWKESRTHGLWSSTGRARFWISNGLVNPILYIPLRMSACLNNHINILAWDM